MKCSKCIHFDRCKWLLSRTGEETFCDWTPSRFSEDDPLVGLFKHHLNLPLQEFGRKYKGNKGIKVIHQI